MAYEHILLDETNAVAKLTINRPDKLNGLAKQTLSEMIDAIDTLRDQGSARVLLLTGSGRGFSSGADLSGDGDATGISPDDVGAILESHYNPFLERLFNLPIPVVTAVNGPAAGAGCSLALTGDIVIAARSAYFLQAFVNIGLVPDFGSTWLLPRLAGRARAQAMMMLGERIPAEQALDWGMIYKVVDDDMLMDEATAMAARLAAGPTKAYALIRHGVRQCLEASLTEALQIERRHQFTAGRTEDFAEGVSAFIQKRKAEFKGR